MAKKENKLTQDKALEILSDGRVHGKRLTRKQKKFFGAIAGGAEPYKAENGIEGTMGGLTNKGFNFNPAWGGAWKNGGWLDKYADGGNLQPPMAGADQTVPMAQKGKYLSASEYEKKYPPIYLNNPKDPRIGGYAEAGNEYRYRKPTQDVERTPIYTSDPRDPRLRMYQDSLSAYIENEKRFRGFKPYTKEMAKQRGMNWNPNYVYILEPNDKLGVNEFVTYKPKVKKPVQPVIYKKPEPKIDKVTGWNIIEGTQKDFDKYYKQSPLVLEKDGIYRSDMGIAFKFAPKPKPKPPRKLERPNLDVDLPEIEFEALPQPNVEYRSAAANPRMISETPTKYSYTYPSGNEQKTIYFPSKSSWKAFTEQYDGLSTEERAGSFSASPGTYSQLRRPNPAFGDLKFAMGGSLPGAVGFMYARTAGAAPSEGPYAKKTLPSAQNGAEMSFYQQGLDWRPKTISKNGKSMKKAQVGTRTQIMGDLLSNHNLKSREQIIRESELRKKAAQANTSQQPYAWMNKQSFVGPSNITESTRITNRADAADARAYDAISNSALSQTMQLATPGGKNPMAGMIGASTLVDMNPITGPVTAAGRLTQHGLGYNPYGFGESGFDNFIGGVSVVGDILGTRANYKLLPGSVRPRPSVREEGGDVPKGQNGLTENEKNKILKYLGKDKQKSLSQAELNKIVSKDPKRLQALNTPEAVKENRKRIAEERKRQEQEREKADLTRRFIENQGTISVPGPPQSALSRAWEIATNPVEAFGYAVRNERLPQNFSKARTKTTALDDLTYMINPLSIVDAVINTGGSLYDTGESIYEGDLPGAAMNLFSTSLNALGSLPAIGGAMSLKNVAKPVVKGFKSTWKATPDLPAMTRFKNALNAGSLELNYPGDIHGHSYFNMTPAETVGKMNEELRELGVGAFTMDRSMSNNSAPLFWKKAASLADKDITLIRPGSEQFVNRYGVLGRRVASAIPEEAADMYPSIVKDYEDQIANLLQSGVPSMVARGQQMQKEGLGRHILDQIKQQDTPSARTYYNQFLKNYKPVLDEGIIEVNQRTGLNFPMTRIESAGGYDSHIMPTVIAVKGNPLTRITEALSAPWKDYYLGPRMLDPTLGRGTERLRTSMYYGDENLGAISQKLIPGVATTQVLGEMSPTTIKQKDGGVVKDNRGYWNPDNWGKVVEIDSNDITMKGVNQPLIGVSDEGDVKYMEPGKNYKFKGNKVKEYPVAQKGFKQASVRRTGPAVLSPSVATSADSLRVYNNALLLKSFYDKLRPEYASVTTDPLYQFDQRRLASGQIQKETLEHRNVSEANKAIIRANKDPNVSYLSDIITGLIDPAAPLAIYDRRISPQSAITYAPPITTSEYLKKKYKMSEFEAGEVRSLYEGYYKNIPEKYNAAKNIIQKYKIDEGKLKETFNREQRANVKLPGWYTKIPYYDPLAVKPYSMRTEKEKLEWEKKYGKKTTPKPTPKPAPKPAESPKSQPSTKPQPEPVKSVPKSLDPVATMMNRGKKVELLVDNFGNYEWFNTDDDTGDMKPIRRATREEIERSKKQRNGGVSVNRADEYPLEKLDNLLNFTNYNKPKAKNGWLEKYK